MKRFFSKGISVFVALAISISALPSVALASDTPSSWAANSVNSAISWGLVPEEVQGRYQDNITRGEFAILLEEVCNDFSGGKQTYTYWDTYTKIEGNPFTDTDSYEIKQMYCAGIMSGIGDGKFGPNELLTREQAATMIDKLFTFCKRPLSSGSSTFADTGKISSWALDSVGKIQAEGIMSGVGYNQFAPQDYYTREQSIVTALKTYEVLMAKKSAGINANSTGGNTGSSSQSSQSSSSQASAGSIQELCDQLQYLNDKIEIANATETMPPNTDTFPKIDSRYKNQGQDMAVGYLEAARSEMVSAVSCWIEIDIYGSMGYTQSTLTSRVRAKRTEIQQHVDKANEYLAKAKSYIQ